LLTRCPVCRARYKNEDHCYRCGTDLVPLQDLLMAAKAEQTGGLDCLLKQDYHGAIKHFDKAQSIEQDSFNALLVAFSRYLNGKAEEEKAVQNFRIMYKEWVAQSASHSMR